MSALIKKDPTGKSDLLLMMTDTEGFRALLDSRSSDEVTSQQDYSNRNCLILATRKNSADVVEMLLKRFYKNTKFLNHKDIVDCTALTYAAEFGFTTIVELLLQAGADPMTTDYFGNTPIIWAAKRGHSDCLKTFGRLVRSLEVWQVIGEDKLDAREWAAKKGHTAAADLIGRIIHLILNSSDVDNKTQFGRYGDSDGDGSVSIKEKVGDFPEVDQEKRKFKDKQPQFLVLPIATSRPGSLEFESESVESGMHTPPIQPLHQATELSPSAMLVTPEIPQGTQSIDTSNFGGKKALIAYNLFSNDGNVVPHRQQALDDSRRELNRTFRRCGFDVVENGCSTLENLTEDLNQMIAVSGIDHANTTAAAVGILEFCQLSEQQRDDLLTVVSGRQSLKNKPKWIVNQGFALPEESLRGNCTYAFSNSDGDTDTNGHYMILAMLTRFEMPGALEDGMDVLMEDVVAAVKRDSRGAANPYYRSFLPPFALLF